MYYAAENNVRKSFRFYVLATCVDGKYLIESNDVINITKDIEVDRLVKRHANRKVKM